MQSHDAEFADHGRTPPVPPHYEMGFRNPIPGMPTAMPLGGNIFDVAVNMLASNLRGGNAGTMAEFLQLAIKAVEANGYGITYAVGPVGEFGLLVIPENPETGLPDMDANPGDYALWCEMGTAENLRETLRIADTKANGAVPRQGKSPVESSVNTD